MEPLTVINTAVGLMSLAVGGFAIWMSLHMYTKAKDSEKATAVALEGIRSQSEALQKLTGKWMDRFTRHATEPRPADEGLMQLVQVVASLPTTILDVVRSPRTPNPAPQQVQEFVNSYIGLYYYTALSNVLAQSILPDENEFDPTNDLHVGVQALVDRSAADFAHMAKVLTGIDRRFIEECPLRRLLDEAISQWRPGVLFTSQVFEGRRTGSESVDS